MKKILASVLALLLCLGLVACGETEQPADTTTPAGDVTTEAPAADTTEAEAALTENSPADTTKEAEVTTEAPVETTEAAAETVSEAEAVCAIGKVYYKDLASAFDAAKEGETVKVLKDFTTEDNVITEATGKITLDGQNHKITANVALFGFLIVDGFNLTIKNLKIDYTESTKSVGNGTLGCAAISVENSGVCTVEDVDIVAYWGDGLNINDGCEFNFKSGSITIDVSNDALQSNMICLNDTGKLVVTDGTFSRMGTGTNKRALIRINKGGCDLTINGGVWECACGRLVYLNNNTTEELARKVVINGGTFTFGADTLPEGFACDPAINLNSKGSDVTINGGTFEIKTGCNMTFFYAEKAITKLTINEGTFTNGAGVMFTAKTATKTEEKEGVSTTTPGGFITVNGGTFTNVAGTMIADDSLAECVILNGGTFNTKDATEAGNVKKYAPTGSKAVVK